MISLEDSQRLQDWQAKALRNELTIDECRTAIEILRQGRTGAQIGSTKSRTAKAAAKKPIDTQMLLKGFLDQMKGES